MRLCFITLLLLLGAIQYHLWFGKNGIKENFDLKNQVLVAEKTNAELKSRNKIMYSEIDNLKHGTEAIIERVRNELGFIKNGETFLRIVPKNDE